MANVVQATLNHRNAYGYHPEYRQDAVLLPYLHMRRISWNQDVSKQYLNHDKPGTCRQHFYLFRYLHTSHI
jgi:hypothetical protein